MAGNRPPKISKAMRAIFDAKNAKNLILPTEHGGIEVREIAHGKGRPPKFPEQLADWCKALLEYIDPEKKIGKLGGLDEALIRVKPWITNRDSALRQARRSVEEAKKEMPVYKLVIVDLDSYAAYIFVDHPICLIQNFEITIKSEIAWFFNGKTSCQYASAEGLALKLELDEPFKLAVLIDKTVRHFGGCVVIKDGVAGFWRLPNYFLSYKPE